MSYTSVIYNTGPDREEPEICPPPKKKCLEKIGGEKKEGTVRNTNTNTKN
jgi:hypothetical protein